MASKQRKKNISITLPIKRLGGDIHDSADPYSDFRRSNIIRGTQFDRDIDALVSDGAASNFRGACKYIYENIPQAQKCVNEIASVTTTHGYKCGYYGKSKLTGRKYEHYVNHTFWNACTIRGHSFSKVLKQAVIAVIRDGEFFVILTEDENGTPKIQPLGAHRVGNRNDDDTYKGYPIVRGIVYDEWGRKIGYKILGYADDGSDDKVVDAADCIHIYNDNYFEQGRGIAPMVSGIESWRDYKAVVYYEKVRQKNLSRLNLKRFSKTGTVSTDDEEYADRLVQMTASSGSVGPGIYAEEVSGMGGETVCLSTNNEEDIEVLEYDSPGANSIEFLENTVLRSAFASIMGWPLELTWNPSQLKGAPMKTIIGQAQRIVDELTESVLLPFWYRVIPWVIAKAVKNGELPEVSDWYLVSPSPVRELTADEFRNSQADIADLKAGLTTYSEIYRKWGMDSQVQLRIRFQEEQFIADLQKEYPDVDPNYIRQWYPNPVNDTSATEDESSVEDGVEDNKEDDNNNGEASAPVKKK